ncbi:endonuclease [Paramecium bursaria Chlorella virus NE-JV-1]|nr:endonuclease [Paramecium bursaria Chlorella virus NE-JV-1]
MIHSRERIEEDIGGITLERLEQILKSTTKDKDSKKYERAFVRDFYNKLNEKNISLPITVILRGSDGSEYKIPEHVYGMRVLADSSILSPEKESSENSGRKTTSKADIALYGKYRKSIAWISHKGISQDKSGKDVMVHAQFLNATSNTLKEQGDDITDDDAYEEIRVFKRKMLELSVLIKGKDYCWPQQKNTRKSLQVWDEIKNTKLIGKSIFGVDYGQQKAFGRQNASAFMHGHPEIKLGNDPGEIYLTASYKTYLNGDKLPEAFLKTVSRNEYHFSTKIDDYKIHGTRVWIVDRTLLRKNTDLANTYKIDNILKNKDLYVKPSCSQLTTTERIQSEKLTPSRAPVFKSKLEYTGIITDDGIRIYYDSNPKLKTKLFYYGDVKNKQYKIPPDVVKRDGRLSLFPSTKENRQKQSDQKNGTSPIKKIFVQKSLQQTLANFAPKRSPSPAPKRSPSPAPKRSPPPAPKRSSPPAPKRSPSPTPKRSPPPAPKRSPPPAPKRSLSPAPKQRPTSKIDPSVNIKTGFDHVSTIGNRTERHSIMYNPVRQIFYYKAGGLLKPLKDSETNFMTKEDRNKIKNKYAYLR